MKPAFDTALLEQDAQALVWVPLTLKVLAAQLATTAFELVEHVLVTRWPGPAVEQAAHVGLGAPPDA